MLRSTFKGGVHIHDGKKMSMDKATTVLLPKGNLVFSMSQHIGAPAKPIVSKGDQVLLGQKIGQASGYISSNIISSVSGIVKAIEKRLMVSGDMVESVVIENDNKYKSVEGYGENRDYSNLSKAEIRDIIKEAGIVGLGGAGFPTHVKLTPKDDAIDYIIVNGAECEPYLTSDYRIMMEEPEKLVKGLKIILGLFDKAKGIIAIEENKPEAISKIEEIIANEPRIEVKALKTKYPQGAERQLIYVTTGRKINSSMLPADVACIVDNVGTVLSIFKAVAENKPLTSRIVTVSGDAVANPQNIKVLVGTEFTQVLEAAGGFIGQPEKVISGGPMMGTALFNLKVPVTKLSNALLGFLEDEADVEETPCIACGRCYQVCPGRLLVKDVAKLAAKSDDEAFIKLNGMECCACGCCTYICPAKRNLAQRIFATRNRILAKKKVQ